MEPGTQAAAQESSSRGKPLIIVESPSKARTLERYLEGRYDVRASVGHVRDLPKSDFGIDEEHDFKQTYVVVPGKEATIRELKKASKDHEHVLLGTDPDREGEAISWHLAEALKLKDPLRVEFHEITKSAVEKALAEPRPIDQDLVNAQIARRVIDRLVGYKISPVLWRKVKPSISAGRVQSVAVRLVVEREAEIQAFVPVESWSIEADLHKEGAPPDFKAKLLTRAPADSTDTGKAEADDARAEAEGDGAQRPEVPDEATAETILTELRAADYAVRSVEKKEVSRNPAHPYTTSTLQQDASSRLRFNPRRTMVIAQQLYEGVDIGSEGPTGLITYMRTDSTRVSEQATGAAREHIVAQFGSEYARTTPLKARGGNAPVAAQEAHEAVRPTEVRRTPDSVREYLSNEQFRLYQLVWRRFVASQMAAARFDTTRVDIAAGSYILRTTGSILRFDGFYRVWEREADSEEAAALPDLGEGDPLTLLDLTKEQHFTQPPPRYTEASLIKELEERGIGRPSTYAPTIETIERRRYVKVEERRLHPTPLGKAVTEFLVGNFGHLFEYAFTANMETDLDRIEDGTNWIPIMREFNKELTNLLDNAREADPVRPTAERIGEKCPKCSEGELVKRQGRYGEFVGCSRYPDCDYIKDRDERPEPVAVGKDCPECGRPLVQRQSRRGPFVGCSGYPDCRYIEKDGSPRPAPEVLDEACPICGKPMVLRRGRYGPFKSCSDYPRCKGPARARRTPAAKAS
jgi:DNA topoisomerase-1